MPETDAEKPPPEFVAIFGRLARQTTTPRMFDRSTLDAYWVALRGIPIARLEAGAVVWAAAREFFPTIAEWIKAARRAAIVLPPGDCARCGDRGLIKVSYHDGNAFDIAICDCRAGQIWRRRDDLEVLIRARLELGPNHRVAYLEDFSDEDPA